MIKQSVIIAAIILISFSSSAQIIVSQTGTVAQWVQNVLTGNGVTVSNVTYTGSLQSVATFTTGTIATNLGISSGMILCTGNATSVSGLANGVNASTNTNGGSDPLLAALIPQSINDAAVIEFDFVPLSDTIKFKYVFGSEEYPEFVPSFNDVFGFFISGLNPSGGNYVNQNVALIPGTTTPVSIYNINNGQFNTGPCVNCNYYVNNATGATVAYDAFTVPLYATFTVIPCFTYHIKLVIGDAGDHVYDSGVFLEANSFGGNNLILNTSTSNNVDTVAVEDCNDAIVTFKIPYITPVPKSYYFYASGTATEGVDYLSLPNHIVIPAGSDSFNLVISPIHDGITEGTEYVRLVVSTSSCTYDTVDVYIKDNYDLIVNMPNDTVLCNGATTVLEPLFSGGYSPYSYQWSDGSTDSILFIDPNATTIYTVTLTDVCNNDTFSQMNVYASSPQLSITGDSACINDSVFLSVTADTTYTFLWNTGDVTSSISLSILNSAYFSVVATDTFGCKVGDSTFVKAFPAPNAVVSPDTTICDRDFAKLRAGGNYQSYQWDNGAITKNITVTPSTQTRYGLLVTAVGGCWDTTSVLVDVLDAPIAVITCDVDTLCLGKFVELKGSFADEIHWSTGEVSQNIFVQPVDNMIYTLNLTNVVNATRCSHDTSFSLHVINCNKFYIPSAFSPNGDGLNDEFGVVGIFEAVDKYTMYIYNRYGELVFKSDSPLIHWDGKYNGSEAEGAVYTYIVIIHETLREKYTLKGTVHLLR